MPKQNNILLIENQFTQFKIIIDHLNNEGYSVFPDEIDFQFFIDQIRIFLNKRYGGIQSRTRRSQVLKEILKYIKDKNISIIIIDYILVGNHDGENGIFLAKKFRENEISTPIIFLSRELQNKRDVMANLCNDVNPYKWIHKGYAGTDILEEEYFKKHVIPQLSTFMEESKDQIYINKIEEIKNLNIFNKDGDLKENIHRVLNQILENKVFSVTVKLLLDKFDGRFHHLRKKFYKKLTQEVMKLTNE